MTIKVIIISGILMIIIITDNKTNDGNDDDMGNSKILIYKSTLHLFHQ